MRFMSIKYLRKKRSRHEKQTKEIRIVESHQKRTFLRKYIQVPKDQLSIQGRNLHHIQSFAAKWIQSLEMITIAITF